MLILFRDFLLNPNDIPVIIPVRDRIKLLLYSFFFCHIWGMLSTILTKSIITLLSPSFVLRDISLNNQNSQFYNFFIVLILAPIVEELAFRLPLNKKPLGVFISFSIFTFVLLGVIKKSFNLDKEIIWFFYSIIIFAFFYFRTTLSKIFFKNNRFILYFFSFTFGVFHIINFSFKIEDTPFLILLTIPQMGWGVVLSFVRLKFENGLLLCILLHILLNFPSAILLLLK